MTKTKIIATLGPATQSHERIEELLLAGVDVFRLNASHGTPEERTEMVARIRRAEKDVGQQVGILLDLQGPKIRLGRFQGGKALLEAGATFTITTEEVLGDATAASTTYPDFAKDLKPGDRVLLADGTLELEVTGGDSTAVKCLIKREIGRAHV